jgi:O-antigen/teichoic acid export membrane protein
MIFDIKNIIKLTSIPISQVIRNLVIVLLMTKTMSIAEVGIWGQVLAVHAFLYMLINLNLTHAMSRFFPVMSSDKVRISEIFYGISTVVLANSILVSIILIIFDIFFSQLFFKSEEYSGVIWLLTIFILLENIYNNIYSLFRSLQEFHQQAKLVIYRSFFELFIIGGGIIFFSYSNLLSINIIFYLFFLSLIFVIIVGLIIAFKSKLLVLTAPKFYFLKKYLNFGVPQLPASLSHWSINLSDRLIIGYYLGLDNLGVYFIANRLSSILTFPLTPIGTMLYTGFSKKHDNGEVINENKILIVYSVAIISFSVLMYWFIGNFIHLLVDSNQKEILDLVFFMMISMVLLNVISILNIFDSVKKKSKKIGLVWTVIGLCNVLLNLYLIPEFGMVGAVYSSIISYTLGLFLNRFLYVKY